MGKTKQKTRIMHDVALNTNTATAIGEGLTGPDFSYIEDEAHSANLTLASPVMTRVNAVNVMVPVQAPTDDEVRASHDRVGLEISSFKRRRAKGVKEAERKYKLLTDALNADGCLEGRQTEFRNKLSSGTIAKIPGMDIEGLMNSIKPENLLPSQSGKSNDEYLVKNYERIKNLFLYLPDMKALVDRGAALLSNPGTTDTEKERIYKLQARYKAFCDVKAYYDTLESMMKNKFYIHLPQSKMEKLSYRELMHRLDDLYSVNPRDQETQELIDYYQGLVRLKELDISDFKSVSKREKKYYGEAKPAEEVQDERTAAKEMKKMAAAYGDLKKYVSGKKLLSDGTKDTYYKKLFETFEADILKFYNDPGVDRNDRKIKALMDGYQLYLNRYFPGRTGPHIANPGIIPAGPVLAPPSDDIYNIVHGKCPEEELSITRGNASSSGINLSNEQNSGIKRIGRAVFENAISQKRIPFANNLLQAPPDQQLIIFYLAQGGLTKVSVDAGFFTAIKNFRPDPTIFEKKYKESDWTALSRSVRKSFELMEQLTIYNRLETGLSTDDNQIEQDKTAPAAGRTVDDMKRTVVDAISRRGQLLKMLYRNAGLHDDMPPDLVEDRALRQKLISEYVKMIGLIRRLSELNGPAAAGAAPNQVQTDYEPAAGTVRADRASLGKKAAAMDRWGDANEYLSYMNEYGVNIVAGAINDSVVITDVFNSFSTSFSQVFSAFTIGFSGTTLGLGSLFGLAGALVTSVDIAKAEGISVADRTARAMSVTGDWSGALGSGLSSGGTFASIGSATAATGLSCAGGVLAAVAGGAKMIASGVQFGRQMDSHDDISKAELSKKRLDARRQSQNPGQPLPRPGADEMAISRFLKHESRESARKATSAGIGFLNGAVLCASGVLMAIPATAGIGAALALTSIVIDVGARIGDKVARNSNRKKAVDDYLHLDEMVSELKNHPPAGVDLSKAKDSDIRNMVKEEALSMLGFSSSDECYRHICRQFAEVIYRNVFINPNTNDRYEYEMYENAMKSLGLKIDMAAHKPTVEQMFTVLMTQ